MNNQERMNQIITNHENGHMNTVDAIWLIEQAGRVQQSDTKHTQLNVFLQEKNFTAGLGMHVVDAAMLCITRLEEREQELESENRNLHKRLSRNGGKHKSEMDKMANISNNWRKKYTEVHNELAFERMDKPALKEKNQVYKQALIDARKMLNEMSGTLEVPMHLTVEGAYQVFEILNDALKETNN